MGFALQVPTREIPLPNGEGVGGCSGYLYDEWNVVAQYDLLNSNVRLRSFVWGLDKSGTLQGAGGVGGLLEVKETSGSYANQRLVFLYDANGNVSQIYTSDHTLVAQYEYDAFGNTLRATGAYAQDNKYRFSTKPVDDAFAGVSYLNGTGNPEQIGTQGGLYYYGFRFYAPALGRWINRDPIEEQGGVNLYASVSNDGINKWDVLGKFSCFDIPIDLDDPESSCLAEGYYRHCVNSCILKKCLAPLTFFANSIGMGSITNIITDEAARAAGGDYPDRGKGGSFDDLKGNKAGRDEGDFIFGNCENGCRSRFYAQVKESCCHSDKMKKKNAKDCCDEK